VIRFVLSSAILIACVASPPVAGAAVSRLALAVPEEDTRIALAAQLAAQAEAEGMPTASEGLKPRGSDVWRSAVIPGWGQWRAGYRDIGLAFMAVDLAAWTTLAVSVGQGHMRRGSSEETALRDAGIDLTAVDDEFRKRVSDFPSSDEYNRLVVMRDAAALYYGDFESYNRYIDENALTGDEAWSFSSEETWERYRRERRTSESAFQRARFAAGALLVNRVVSAIVASRLKPKTGVESAAAAPPRTQIVWGVGTSPGGSLEPRLGCVARF
jgi:hypothetical protein